VSRVSPIHRVPLSIDAVEFARKVLAFDPDEKQAELLVCADQQVILNCTRQWGKSTVTAARAVWQAWSKPESLVLVVSPCERQSNELVRKAHGLVSNAGVRAKGDGQNRCSLVLPNGSRIIGLPSDEGKVRGFSSVSLLVIDEASRVPEDLYRAMRPVLAVSGGDLWLMSTPNGRRGFSSVSLLVIEEAARAPEDLYKAMRPVLAVSGGDLWLMSTPYGRRGFFWDAWSRGGPGWTRVSVPATECARIPADFLAEEREAHTEEWFRQEYLCEFVQEHESLIDRELLEAALTDDFGPLWTD